MTVVDRRFVEGCHTADMAVHVWTIDDPDRIRRLFELGVDGFMTDEVGTLRDLLVAERRWEKPS